MSASSSPALISKAATDQMKLVLTKDGRVRPIPSKAPVETSVTKATTTPSVLKSVIKEAPPKGNSTSGKPIVVPSVPNLLPITQSTLSQFFSTSVPPTNLNVPPHTHPTTSVPPHHHSTTVPPHPHSTVPPHPRSTVPSHSRSTVAQNTKPIGIESYYNKIAQQQQHPQVTLKTHSNLPPLKPKKSPATRKILPKKTTDTISILTNKPEVRKLENGVIENKAKDIHPPNPKKPKVAKVAIGSSSLPLSRVRTIMKTNVQSNQNVVNTSQESVALITRATEMFIAELAKRSGKEAKEKATVTYNHLANAVQESKDVQFLHAVVPRKVLAKDYISPPLCNGNTSDKE